MSHKQVLFHAAACEEILQGATQLVEAVRITQVAADKPPPFIASMQGCVTRTLVFLGPPSGTSGRILRDL